jgi:glycosyltransferase involved in cell wall biosynthesis
MVLLSVVIPVFNECNLINELIKRVIVNVKLITEDFEIILVDDGSVDSTWEKIKSEASVEKRIIAVRFSRNFGHHYAITAGLHKAIGDWVVVMDGDLQDRPEVIPELYKKARENYDVVFVSRIDRPERIYYRVAQKIFYLLLRYLSGVDFDSKQANFSIISRKVVNAFKTFPEQARFYGSTIKWLGFKTGNIEASHGIRFSGKPSYTIKKRLKLASDIILAFSDRPLKFAVNLGLFLSLSSIISIIYLVYRKIYFGFSIVGWTSVISTILFIGGMILSVLGVLGIYISRIFSEVKRRPLYIIRESIEIIEN